MQTLTSFGWMYLGGLVASLPMGFGMRDTPLSVRLLVSIGWPIMALGIALGVLRLNGGVEEG